MSGDRHRRLAQIFQRVVELAPAARADFLDEACPDAAERAEVEALLRGDASDTFLPRGDSGPAPAVAQALAAARLQPLGSDLPPSIGRYRVLRELGSGAMGRVLLARQERTEQLVALKLIRPGLSLTTPGALERFARETRILGRLGHPGIARILDAGSARIGEHDQPYIAVEYVAGRHLSDFAREEHLDLHARLELLAQLGDAVQHAHDHGVVHRDLKPENVIVTSQGQPKVLDFGVARVTDRETQLTTVRTAGGQLIGTLAYMSPEQASGGALEVDARSDVYALGVLGYELVSGRRPHRLEGLDFVAAARVICQADPDPLRVVAPALPRDVATILYKALAREASERYPSAAALSEDLRRFVRDEPIVARPATGLYVLKKLARRHRGLTVGLLAALLTLVTGTIVSLVFATRAMHSSEAARWQAYLATLAAASSEVHTGSRQRARERLDRAPEEHRGVEWRILHNLADQSQLCLTGHGYNVWNAAFSADGSRAFSCAGDATVRVWDLGTGTQTALLDDHSGRVFSVAASPDGSRFASGSADRTVRLRDARSLQTLAVLQGHDEGAFGLAFTHDSERLAVGSSDGDLRLWNARNGEPLRILQDSGAWVWSITFTPDDARMLVAFDDGTVGVFDVASGERLALLETGGDRAVDVSLHPDGARFAVATTAGSMQLWDIDSHERLASVQAHDAELGSVEIAPDGRLIATGARDGTLAIWDAASLERVTERVGHSDWVQSLAFSADGTRLLSASWDDTLRVWDARRLDEIVAPASRHGVKSFALDPGGLPALHILRADGSVTVEHVLTGRPLPGPEPLFGFARARVRRRDGSLVALSSGADGSVLLMDPRSGETRNTLGVPGEATQALAFDASGEHLLTSGSDDCSVIVWHAATGERRGTLMGHVDTVLHAVADSTGTLLATGATDGVAYLWSARTFERVGALEGHGSPVRCTAFSPDGRRIATGTDDGRVRLWSRDGLEELAVFPAAASPILQLEFTPGSDLLLLGSSDGTLLVLDGRK